jgi:DNA-binding winged helix-turn-helix (wHTH) protein
VSARRWRSGEIVRGDRVADNRDKRHDDDQSTVTVHIRRLREKIEADPADPRLLATVWGVGYRLDPPEDNLAALPATGTSQERRRESENQPSAVGDLR